MSREDQAHVTVHIDYPGLGDMGTWEDRTGGTGDADSTKHREGGMGPERSYGGPQTLENVSVKRRYDPVRDAPLLKLLMAARGRAKMTVTEQLADEYGVAFGDTVVYTGKLKAVDQGNVSGNSNNIRMITLEQDTESVA
jgi:hypothetical protein